MCFRPATTNASLNKCPQCGAQNAPGTETCAECGTKIAHSAPAAPSVPGFSCAPKAQASPNAPMAPKVPGVPQAPQ